MSPRAVTLAQRQTELLMRSEQLRARIASDAQVLQRPLALADSVSAGWNWLRVHPEATLAAVAVVVVLRPRRALAWATRLWGGWRLVQRLGLAQPLIDAWKR